MNARSWECKSRWHWLFFSWKMKAERRAREGMEGKSPLSLQKYLWESLLTLEKSLQNSMRRLYSAKRQVKRVMCERECKWIRQRQEPTQDFTISSHAFKGKYGTIFYASASSLTPSCLEQVDGMGWRRPILFTPSVWFVFLLLFNSSAHYYCPLNYNVIANGCEFFSFPTNNLYSF